MFGNTKRVTKIEDTIRGKAQSIVSLSLNWGDRVNKGLSEISAKIRQQKTLLDNSELGQRVASYKAGEPAQNEALQQADMKEYAAAELSIKIEHLAQRQEFLDELITEQSKGPGGS